MDKSMIREALQRIANDLSPNNLPIDAVMEGHHGLTVRRIADRCFNDAIQALAELDKPGEGDPDAHLSDEDYLKAKQDRFAKGGLANVDPDKYMEEVRGTGKVLTDEVIERLSIPEQWEGEDYIIGGMKMGLMIHKNDRVEAQRIVKHVLRYVRDRGYLAPAKAPAEVAPSPQAVTVDGKWISVEEQVPDGPVLLAGPAYNDPSTGDYWQRTGFYSRGTLYENDDFDPWEGYSPTHWMPLPSAPDSTNT